MKKTFLLPLLTAFVVAWGHAQQTSSREIELNGQTWTLDCRGTGLPAVVFESGLGSSAEAWSAVADSVGGFARACTYRRPAAQNGFPERAADLRALLEKAQENGPFVLVGHSQGAYVVRLFSSAFPQATAGFVLVDPAPELLAENAQGLMPEDHRQMWLRSEEEIRQQLAESALPERPLIVLSSEQIGIPKEMAEGYQIGRLVEISRRLREALAQSVPQGEHRFIAGSGHSIHRERPEVVVEAIRQVWQRSR